MQNSVFYAGNTLASFLIGIVILTLMLINLITRVNFLFHANPFDAMIVEVSFEKVPMGRGAVMAYVPVVEV